MAGLITRPFYWSNQMAKTKIEPLREIGLAEHDYRRHNAMVPSTVKEKDLTNKDYWVHVSHKLQGGDEIRCIAEDNSFVAYLIVLHVNRPDVLLKCIGFHVLESVPDQSYDADPNYIIKRGPGRAGWYVQTKETGDKIVEGLESQSKAFKALEDHKRALAA